MKEIKVFLIWFLIYIFIFIFILILLSPIPYLFGKSVCKSQYKDSKFWFFSWCMVQYKWEYIPEKLYIKAFEQNLIINK